MKTFIWKFVPCLVAFLLEECILRLAQPLFLGYMINYFTVQGKSDEGLLKACIAAGGLCLTAALFIVVHHPFALVVTKLGMDMRVASCTLLYKKSLRLNNAALKKTAIGHIVNVMSNDAHRFDLVSKSKF